MAVHLVNPDLLLMTCHDHVSRVCVCVSYVCVCLCVSLHAGCGSASHFGVVADCPTIGVAKNLLSVAQDVTEKTFRQVRNVPCTLQVASNFTHMHTCAHSHTCTYVCMHT